ncbi:MAG: hypothetical protein J6S14_11665 [Clostridia bacterium]|nr:hypothetical protein [Clostridia bacterium]
MRVEIWMGGTRNPTYIIEDVTRLETSVDGAFCRITDSDDCVYETSPHNIVIISESKKGGESDA